MNRNTRNNNKNNKINKQRKRRNRPRRRNNNNNTFARMFMDPPPKTARQLRRIRMPAAITASVPKLFYNRSITGTSAKVSGCDLVYQIPDDLTSQSNSQVITIIPANPAYWTGTRIAAVASGYQNYRPLRFEVIYIPQCAVTQQGNVIGGTLWNEAPTINNLQQTLKTSNGGMLTQCYKQATSIVRMKTNLQYNLYRMGGKIDQESNPFVFIALAIACKNTNNQAIVPGYFYIRYSYVLKNPIGTGINYQNSQLTTRQAKTTYLLNASLYLCSPITTENDLQVPTGSRIDVEYDNNNNDPRYLYYYNGTPLKAESITNIWVLENQPNIPSNLQSLKVLKTANEIYYSSSMTTSQANQRINVGPGYGVSYVDLVEGVKTLINNTLGTLSFTILSPNTKVHFIEDVTQNFGSVSSMSPDGILGFTNDPLWTIFKMMTTIKTKILLSQGNFKLEQPNDDLEDEKDEIDINNSSIKSETNKTNDINTNDNN